MSPIRPRNDPPSDEAPTAAILATVDDVGAMLLIPGEHVTLSFAEPAVSFTLWVEESFHGGARWSARSSAGGDPIVLGARDPLLLYDKPLARVAPICSVASAALPLLVAPDVRLAFGFSAPRRVLVLPPSRAGDAPFGPLSSTFERVERLARDVVLGFRPAEEPGGGPGQLVIASASGVLGPGASAPAPALSLPVALEAPSSVSIPTAPGEPPFAILLSPVSQ